MNDSRAFNTDTQTKISFVCVSCQLLSVLKWGFQRDTGIINVKKNHFLRLLKINPLNYVLFISDYIKYKR